MASALTIEKLDTTGASIAPVHIPFLVVHEPSATQPHMATPAEGLAESWYSTMVLRDGLRAVVDGLGEVMITPDRIIGVVVEDKVSDSPAGDCTVIVWEALHTRVHSLLVATGNGRSRRGRAVVVDLGSSTVTLKNLHAPRPSRQPRWVKDALSVAMVTLSAVRGCNAAFADDQFVFDDNAWVAER